MVENVYLEQKIIFRLREHTGLFTLPPTRSSSGSKQQTTLRSASSAVAVAEAGADAVADADSDALDDANADAD